MLEEGPIRAAKRSVGLHTADPDQIAAIQMEAPSEFRLQPLSIDEIFPESFSGFRNLMNPQTAVGFRKSLVKQLTLPSRRFTYWVNFNCSASAEN